MENSEVSAKEGGEYTSRKKNESMKRFWETGRSDIPSVVVVSGAKKLKEKYNR